jgi:hypothetical protein
MFKYRLAKDLNKTLGEVNQMPLAEVIGWAAFYEVEWDEQKKAMGK